MNMKNVIEELLSLLADCRQYKCNMLHWLEMIMVLQNLLQNTKADTV